VSLEQVGFLNVPSHIAKSSGEVISTKVSRHQGAKNLLPIAAAPDADSGSNETCSKW
jgi:hypothetical protein